MTRATLLHLLAHPAALTGPDVRALEELAQAFPYCQSAHLLLAKAAHDQGSMLAAQRLRRAATYAADRTRLRQLIEMPAPAEAETAVEVVAEAAPLAAAIGELAGSPPALAALVGELPAAPASLADADNADDAAPAKNTGPTDQQAIAAFEDKPDQFIGAAPAEAAEAEKPSVESAATSQPAETPVTSETAEAVAHPLASDSVATSEAPATGAPPRPEPLPEAELPAQAPPIRPPAEAGAARFEFGLAPAEPAEIMAYRLPELAEPVAVAVPAVTTPQLPAFSGGADVQYAPGEGSRLGFCLVPAGAAAGAAGLPPAGEFFAPDALLLEHLAAHQPPAPPRASSPLDLINSFLQRAPAASRRRAMPTPAIPDTDLQADLSVRSTRAEPDLASENLAHILARQGKNDRAIAVYERLMVKYPEKMAYFAAQIESLRPSA